MNNENLRPMNTRTKEEAQELGRKGGKASGKARQERARLRETMQALLACTDKAGAHVPYTTYDSRLSANATLEEALCMSTISHARQGNMQAMRLVFEVASGKFDDMERQSKATLRKLEAEAQIAEQRAEAERPTTLAECFKSLGI